MSVSRHFCYTSFHNVKVVDKTILVVMQLGWKLVLWRLVNTSKTRIMFLLSVNQCWMWADVISQLGSKCALCSPYSSSCGLPLSPNSSHIRKHVMSSRISHCREYDGVSECYITATKENRNLRKYNIYKISLEQKNLPCTESHSNFHVLFTSSHVLIKYVSIQVTFCFGLI